MQILSINPGSTSTKIAVYEDLNPVFVQNLKHSTEELSPFNKIIDQYDFRKKDAKSDRIRIWIRNARTRNCCWTIWVDFI